MINRVILTGRLCTDVDFRMTPSGVAVAKFKIAVNRTFKQDGQSDADFISIVAWKRQAENVNQYCKKGSLVGIDGRMQTGSYEGQNGRVYTTDVVAESVQFLEPKQSNEQSKPQFTPQFNNQYGMNQQSANSFQFDPDDMPF